MIIKNRRALERSYLPDEIVDRERELLALESLHGPTIKYGSQTHSFIYGGVGVGKTTIARFFMKSLPGDGFVKVYHSCLWARGPKDILSSILKGAGRRIPTLRGYSRGELIDLADRALDDRHLFLVLDEAHSLMQDSLELLEAMIRGGLGGGISTMLVSLKSPDLVIPRSLRSVIGYTSAIKLEPYDKDTLFRILEQRALISLAPGAWDDDLLSFIADAAAPYGDARLAIEILYRAAEGAQSKGAGRISVEDAREAMANINPFLTESKLAQLDEMDLMLLLALSRILKRRAVASVKDVYEEYVSLVEEGIAPIASYGTIHRRVKRLVDTGILSASKKGERGKGVKLLVTLTDFPAEGLEKLILKRLKERGD